MDDKPENKLHHKPTKDRANKINISLPKSKNRCLEILFKLEESLTITDKAIEILSGKQEIINRKVTIHLKRADDINQERPIRTSLS